MSFFVCLWVCDSEMFLGAQVQGYIVFKAKLTKTHEGQSNLETFLAEYSSYFRHNFPVILVNTSGLWSRLWKFHMCC